MVMSPAVYDTLILSDLHLGSEISRAEQAARMLRENRFRRLILLGDIFSDLNFGRLTKPHWEFSWLHSQAFESETWHRSGVGRGQP